VRNAIWKGRLLQLMPDRLENAVEVSEDLAVPEPHHAITVVLEELRAHRIVRNRAFLCMLTAIQLNNQPSLGATEVNDVRTFRNLSLELPAIDPPVSQP
jgi:hypothetical protein